MNNISRRSMRSRVPAALVGIGLLIGAASSATAQEQTIHERMFHSRAVEAVVWAMPLLNFKCFRDGQQKAIAASAGPTRDQDASSQGAATRDEE